MHKDNTTLREKVSLRRKMLALVDHPVVLESNGGLGMIYLRCYAHLKTGVVIEKDDYKAAALGRQRPTWAVYQADCVGALRGGAGSHLPVNVLDVDPYGEPWPIIDAFLESKRNLPPVLAVVVNDGLRQKIQMGGAWNVTSLQSIVSRYGNNLYRSYLDVCQILLQEKAAQAGYTVSRFAGYYCGHNGQMTHYLAIAEKAA